MTRHTKQTQHGAHRDTAGMHCKNIDATDINKVRVRATPLMVQSVLHLKNCLYMVSNKNWINICGSQTF